MWPPWAPCAPLQDAGLRVPTDVSVIGFDDIRAAAFISPSLTTVRQPLREMGWMASEYLLARLQGVEKFREQIVIYPALTVRESTAAVAHAEDAPNSHRKSRREAKSKLHPPGIGRPPLPRNDRRLISVVWLHVAFAATGFGTTLLGCLLPALHSAWNLTDAQAGFLFACQFTGAALGALLVRENLFRSIQQGYLLMVAGAIALGALHGYAADIVFFFFGIGMGWAMTAINMVGGTFFERPGAALSLLNASWIVGAALSPEIATRWVRYAPPMRIYFVVAVAFALIALILQHYRTSLLGNNIRRLRVSDGATPWLLISAIFSARISIRRRRSLCEWLDDDLRSSPSHRRRFVGSAHHFLLLACASLRPSSRARGSIAGVGIAPASGSYDRRWLQRAFDFAESLPGDHSSLCRACRPGISAHFSTLRIPRPGAHSRITADEMAFLRRRNGRLRAALVDRQAFHAHRLVARRLASTGFCSGDHDRVFLTDRSQRAIRFQLSKWNTFSRRVSFDLQRLEVREQILKFRQARRYLVGANRLEPLPQFQDHRILVRAGDGFCRDPFENFNNGSVSCSHHDGRTVRNKTLSPKRRQMISNQR